MDLELDRGRGSEVSGHTLAAGKDWTGGQKSLAGVDWYKWNLDCGSRTLVPADRAGELGVA